MLIAKMASSSADNSEVIGFLAITALAGYGLWRLLRWFFSGPMTPDPWDDPGLLESTADEPTPVCHRCLEPHSPAVNFCPHCAAPVGAYTNLLPFPYLFSIGHMLRIGTSGEFKRTPFTIAGFVLFSLAEYAVFAPVYWFMPARKLGDPPENSSAETPVEGSGDDSSGGGVSS